MGRSLERYPIQLHGFECNITHNHLELSVTDEQRPNLPGFLRSTHSLIARCVNRTWEREGHLFAARPRLHPCLDDKAAEQKLIYALTNPVKDNLVETVSQSPFFSTYRHQAFGDEKPGPPQKGTVTLGMAVAVLSGALLSGLLVVPVLAYVPEHLAKYSTGEATVGLDIRSRSAQ